MHAITIHNVLAQGRTVQKPQKGGSNPPNPLANHTLQRGNGGHI